MGWQIATAQSLGGRDNQEDSLLALAGESGGPMLIAVADGAGGHAEGEKASAAAIEALKRRFAQATAADGSAWLKAAIGDAATSVSRLGSGPSAPRTTLVAAFCTANRAAIGHVGDSRLYHFSNGKLAFRTRDHSVVQLLVDMGRLKEDSVNHHPDRSRLTKALGGSEAVDFDVAELALAPGDGLLLCSDGVWEHARPQELEAALRADDLERAARQLVDAAVRRGGSDADNATLILARMR